MKYYEIDSVFKRNTPIRIYDLLRVNKGIVLDVGCGDGDTFCLLSPSVFPIGVEISRIRTKRVRKHASVILADAQELPIRNGAIDFVVASEILEHLPFPQKCLHEVYRVLKNRGKLGIIIPNDKVYTLYRLTNLKEIWKVIAYRYQHFWHFNIRNFMQFLDKYNVYFTVMRVYTEKRKWKCLKILNRVDIFHWYIITQKCAGD
ncbi:MAG: class I SAM-dependent methyltransferase [Nitrososphaerota archaeon]